MRLVTRRDVVLLDVLSPVHSWDDLECPPDFVMQNE